MTSSTTAAFLQPVRLSPDGSTLLLLDQRALPGRELWLVLNTIEAVAQAIESLAVRGAPAIGCTAALGLAVACRGFPVERGGFAAACELAIARLARTRPTAVNLFHALQHMRAALASAGEDRPATLRAAAEAYVAGELEACLRIGEYGAPLLPEGTILTHCNTGALATAGFGTALGVIRRAHALGKAIRVLADETRPVLQGARLTAWELQRDGIPVEVIADNMAGALMSRGEIQAAIVGADRITRRGDVANKIGTYTVAVLCHHHRLPFYVAAPWSTIDLAMLAGAEIPIEQRDPDEVHFHGGTRMTPIGVGARNPAFDVTPAELVTAIITDRGVFTPAELARAAG
ncbi:S-methyl-5-thioribose-1-phosphate isomerase [Nannocystis sp.]|uniref:S-methyl-5-thioribose-1-phosphate isomerase n=1 Tax=Nannocystis sp. TaxID=1962667 RepID=UPI0024258766|nr:S-methyl-5-thioribose-1-phosphate isomerase [Nannocystis sp.]MBK7828760.1 S-methyl-5-thioribose-1-phosphate isomerase [Nannocystis sp.]MBK9753944.1 S-methyl-5-thioribose-1-phosphate isomerase [Nannocystis sp.]